jgi:hypothetical protein
VSSSSEEAARPFEADVLERLDEADEVRIETYNCDQEDALRKTSIWIVVDDCDVFVRSVHGVTGGASVADEDADVRAVVRSIPINVFSTGSTIISGRQRGSAA